MRIGERMVGPVALPIGLRRPAAMVMSVAAALFLIFASRYAGNSSPGRLDEYSQAFLETIGPGETRAGNSLIGLGDAGVVVVLASLLAGLCLWFGRTRLAVIAVIGPGVTGLITTWSKPLIGRTLDGDFAYPSGHAGGATALGMVAALLLSSLVLSGSLGMVVAVAGGLVIAGGGMSYLLVVGDVHYPTDAAGGGCVAVAVVIGTALVLDRLLPRQARRQNPPDTHL